MTDTSKIVDAATAFGQAVADAVDALDARVTALENSEPEPPEPQPPDGDIDLSKYTLTFEENFDNPQIYEPVQANDYGLMSSPWVPHYTAYANQYGSSGAIYDECGWMVDPRDPAMAPYNPFSVADSVLSITTRPRPAELDGLPLNNGAGNPTTWLGGALITMGTRKSGGFAQQYGYFEIDMKAPPSLSGNFPAFWLLSATNRWPTEIDVYEGFGANRASLISPTLHSDPYWPSWSNADDTIACVPGANYNVGCDLTQDFHRIGVDVQPEGMSLYFDRKYIGAMPPYCGVTDLTITNAGTTVKADGGGSSGSLRVKILSQSQFKNFAATLTITDGAVTAVQVTQPGSCMTGVTCDHVLLINNTGGSLGDAELTPVIADKDPPLALQYHTPLYMLVNFALGSFTGTPIAPATYQVRSIKAWRRNIEAPAITLSGDPAEDLVQQLKAWKLRFDTTPMTPHQSDWDATKLSLWDALDFLFLAGTETDWKHPEVSLIHHGNVMCDALSGWTYQGGVGTYSDTCHTPTGHDGIRQDDHHLGVWLGDAVTDPTLKAVISAGYKTYLQVSSSSHEYRSSVPQNAGGVIRKLAPGAGHLVFTRGWRYQQQSFHDGQLFHAGYVSTQAPEFASCVVGALSAQYAGPDCRILASHGGRRLMPDEVEVLHRLIGEYFATIGVS